MAKIGELGLDTPSGVVKVPVFDTGDSGSSVYEMVRVQTPSGVGFIPFVDPAEATFPEIRIQTENNGVLAAHDDTSLVKELDQTFNYTGSRATYTVPSGTTEILVKIWGGGVPFRTSAGYVEGLISVSGGETLYVRVGEHGGEYSGPGGWPNGGAGATASGSSDEQSEDAGGSSDIRRSGDQWSDIIALAAGSGSGGRAGYNSGGGTTLYNGQTSGGDGGPNTGEDSPDTSGGGYTALGGHGGEQSSGGNGYTYDNSGEGEQFSGGDGGTQVDSQDGNEARCASGAGGGGYYGGGGGQPVANVDSSSVVALSCGGGGGSNYVGGFSTVNANERGTGGEGHGKIEIYV